MPTGGKRGEIIDAAIRLLASRGGEGLTAAALVSEAGVSKANLFHHFEGLDDIVMAAFERFLLDMESFSPRPGGSLRGWLLALGGETQALMDERGPLAGAYLAFAARARSDPRLLRTHGRDRRPGRGGLRRGHRGMLPGGTSPEEVRSLATLVMIAGDGLAMHRYLFPGRAESQRAAWRSLVDRIAPGEASS